MRETYPLELCKHDLPVLNEEKLHSLLANAKDNDTLKKGNMNCVLKFDSLSNLALFSFDASL